jgi:hypothetical protein
MEFADHDFHIYTEIFPVAQNLDHSPARQGGRMRVIGDFDVYNQAFEVAGGPAVGEWRYGGAALGLPAELAVAV